MLGILLHAFRCVFGRGVVLCVTKQANRKSGLRTSGRPMSGTSAGTLSVDGYSGSQVLFSACRFCSFVVAVPPCDDASMRLRISLAGMRISSIGVHADW
jgi:hypothetical protein